MMLTKLRRKFVLINMSLVTLVLLIVFGVQFWSTAQRLENDSYNALSRVLDRGVNDKPARVPIGGGAPDDHGDFMPWTQAMFVVQLDASGAVVSVMADNVEVAEDTVAAAVAQVKSAGKARGTLTGEGLRYAVRHTATGDKIAFVDLTSERRTLASQALTALLVGLGGLLAFFGVSLFLAAWALRPVERAWRQQQQFIADASHELKTPLTVILANTGILLSHPEDTIAAQRKWLDHTHDEAERMKKMVEDMLFLARSDAAPQDSVRAPFDLSDAAWGCLLPFEPVAFERGVELISDVAPALTVTGDEGQLRQLMVILLDNACKYAGKGGSVHFLLERTPEKAVISVHNTGAPIPPDDLPHLFERFYRADKSRARENNVGGYGLGLSIAERIVTGHKGKIAVESSAERGTTFTVTLPIK